VLKTLGFSNGLVLALVLAESVLLAVVGGVAPALLIGWLLVSQGGDRRLPAGFFIPGANIAAGALLVVALGLVAGIFPAIRATQLRIVDALRRN
jgi:putative ABC transport system permease protein